MQDQNQGLTIRSGINLLYLAVSGYSTCFLVFMRHSFGVEALGINGIVALLAIVGYISFTQSPAMVAFLGMWFVALIVQRIITLVRVRIGWVAHSRYEGYPWLGFKFPFVSRLDSAKFAEMLTCLGAGTVLLGFDEPAGRFVLFGFFGLLAKESIEAEIEHRRFRRMVDAEIEMSNLVDRWNQKRS